MKIKEGGGQTHCRESLRGFCTTAVRRSLYECVSAGDGTPRSCLSSTPCLKTMSLINMRYAYSGTLVRRDKGRTMVRLRDHA